MKKGKNKTALAVILCIVMIAAAVVLGAYKGISALRSQVFVFFESGDGTQKDLGIVYLIEKRLGEAENLLAVTSRYLNGTDSDVKSLNAVMEDLREAKNPNETYALNEELDSVCQTISDRLSGMAGISASDLGYIENITTNMNSYNMQMEHCLYNEKAAEFNTKTLSMFPAGAIARFIGVKELILFE